MSKRQIIFGVLVCVAAFVLLGLCVWMVSDVHTGRYETDTGLRYLQLDARFNAERFPFVNVSGYHNWQAGEWLSGAIWGSASGVANSGHCGFQITFYLDPNKKVIE